MEFENCINKIYFYDISDKAEKIPPGTRFIHIIINYLIDLGEIEINEENDTFCFNKENIIRISVITGYKIDDIYIYLHILYKYQNNEDYSELLSYLDHKYDSIYAKLFIYPKKFKNKQSKSYSEKLKDPKWQKKRLKIFERDDWTCQLCKSIDNTLHIHHFYYLKNKNPWDYDDDALITLCINCHSNEHEIPVIKKMRSEKSKKGSPLFEEQAKPC